MNISIYISPMSSWGKLKEVFEHRSHIWVTFSKYLKPKYLYPKTRYQFEGIFTSSRKKERT